MPLLLPLLLAALLSVAVSQSNAASDWYCVAAPGLADGPLCVYLSADPCLQRLGINITYNSLPIINAAIDGVNPQRICRNLDANGLCQACLAFDKVSISGTGARICPTVVQRCASIDLVTTPLQCIAFGNDCSGKTCSSCVGSGGCGWCGASSTCSAVSAQNPLQPYCGTCSAQWETSCPVERLSSVDPNASVKTRVAVGAGVGAGVLLLVAAVFAYRHFRHQHLPTSNPNVAYSVQLQSSLSIDNDETTSAVPAASTTVNLNSD